MAATLVFLATGCGGEQAARGGREPTAGHAGHRASEAKAGHADHENHGDELGEVRLSPAQLTASGIEVGTAGPRTISIVQELPGEVVVNADRLAHVVPRFPGIAREVRKKLGDRVRVGEVLAVIESNESLSPYEVKSLLAGTVIGKHITLGEFVRDDSDVYVVADLTTVWVNVTIYARDLPRIREGQTVTVRAPGVEREAEARIAYVGPVVGEATRTAVARVVLPNRDGTWRPGIFVTATVHVEEAQVPVAVTDEAVQSVGGRTVVFVAEGEMFVPRPVVTGRSDGAWMEIVSGLAPGESCAFRNSFILKSELGKGQAGHDH
jgi:cobalt-zinc-cadmium efflux system membrane fusion protein